VNDQRPLGALFSRFFICYKKCKNVSSLCRVNTRSLQSTPEPSDFFIVFAQAATPGTAPGRLWWQCSLLRPW